MKNVAEALGISRGHLTTLVKSAGTSAEFWKKRTPSHLMTDLEILNRLKKIINRRSTYGYRRAAAILNKELKNEGLKRFVNHKRVYRLMSENALLLEKSGQVKPIRPHTGKVQTISSNTRWCSDSLVVKCWNGQKLEGVFAMDTCDREILAWKAVKGSLKATDVQDVLLKAVESRFGRTGHAERPLEWLTDNGGVFTAKETQRFAGELGLTCRHTPAYSPESNGMSEAWVKRFKQDYVYVMTCLIQAKSRQKWRNGSRITMSFTLTRASK